MTRLKLADLADEKPVRLTVERLIAAMIERFIATDRGFAKSRKSNQSP